MEGAGGLVNVSVVSGSVSGETRGRSHRKREEVEWWSGGVMESQNPVLHYSNPLDDDTIPNGRGRPFYSDLCA
jgi:hypothetical protein